jgi:CRP-like cAMP-binding protein
VGNEGAVGLNESLGSPPLALDRMCIAGGTAARLPVADFLWLLEASARFNRYVIRYLGLREAVVAQMVVCSRFHPLSARLARTLLAAHLRTGGRPLQITHDRLALLVGASRPRLSAGLDGFRRAGLIDTRPGEIEFLDTAGLRREACYCFEFVRQTYAAIARADGASG